MRWSLVKARSWWARGQGLLERPEGSLAQTVGSTGWIRTLGGAEAYLGLHARAADVSVAAVDRAVAERALQVLPAVRGCIYLVPKQDAAIALRIADRLSARRNARDLEKVGATRGELETVGDAVCEALQAGPLDTRAVAKALPDGVVRSFGAAGKKIGLSSNLPPALRKLEFAGRIHRQPIDNRLDHERYSWHLATYSPLDDSPETDAELHQALARRFVRWAGPCTQRELAAWTGLGQRDAKAALQSCGASEVEVEELGPCWVDADLEDPPAATQARWLPAMDNLIALRASSAWVVDPAGHQVEIPVFGPGGPRPLVDVNVPLARTLALGATVVGLWDADPATGELVSRTFADAPLEDPAAIRAIFKDLTHSKVFGLDSDKTMARRLDAVRAIS